MSLFFDIEPSLIELSSKVERDCTKEYAEIEQVAQHNGEKVLSAFINNRVSESCFYGSTGYGYGDVGRDILDKVFAEIVGAEDALVRHTFVSGTHALTVGLFGVLRPGDKIVSLTGKPYDTLDEVINGAGNGSLKDFGVQYAQVDLMNDGSVDFSKIKQAVLGTKVLYLQRSRGYSLRPSLSVEEIGRIVTAAKGDNPDVIVMVDNCYGEFVQTIEPTQVGADLIIGSFIKNPGGGIARTGGYIAGRKDLVELCAYRLTCVGMGKEVGCTLDQNRNMYMGLFLAPDTVANATKTAVFAAELFTQLGYECYPKKEEQRSDIITAIVLRDEVALTAFCRGIQRASPVDAFLTPEAWDMPGYEDRVIMAAGAFVMGASIELSADAPLREPYAVWLQGGLTYTSGRIGILLAANAAKKLK